MRSSYKYLMIACLVFAASFSGWSSTVQAADNIVPNPSLEKGSRGLPVNWMQSSWGTNSATFKYDRNGHTGSHSVQVNMTSYTSGDAKWYFEAQPVTAGQMYRVSDFYKSNVLTRVVLAIGLTGGGTQYMELMTAPASSSWAHYLDYAVMPVGATTLSVYHLIDQVGFLKTDDYAVTMFDPGFTTGIVSLTFDDGWDSAYSQVLPLLNQYHAKSTFYISTGFLGQENRLTYAQLDQIFAAGNEIGDHTVSHPDLTTLSPAQVRKELMHSKNVLQVRYGPITSFAFPYGAYNNAVLKQVRSYFASARTSDVGYNTRLNFNPYLIRTQNIDATTTPAQVEQWVQQAATDRSWLVLLYHQVDTSGSEYSTTPAKFESNLQAINAQGLPIMTVKAALATIKNQL